MIHALIYHGWPVTSSTARHERTVYHSLINQIDRKYPQEKNLVINGTWLGWEFQHDCEALLQSYQPTQVWIGSLVDPWDLPDSWAKNKFPNSQINYFGYSKNIKYFFDFWALCTNLHVKLYASQDLMLQDHPLVFLCYQNKARPHRQMLTSKLLSAGLDKHGKITLGTWIDDYTYNNLKPMYDIGENHHKSKKYDLMFSNSNCSEYIGNLRSWNNSLIHVVSETEPIHTGALFVTEKTWRPIVGLRPFMIYGDPRIYAYLKDNNFDTFDDIFPVQKLANASNMEDMSDVVVDTLQSFVKMDPGDLKKLYLDLLPRLLANKKQFEVFSRQQQHKIDNFFG